MWCTVGSFLAHYCHLHTGPATALTRACTTMAMGGLRQGLTVCQVQTISSTQFTRHTQRLKETEREWQRQGGRDIVEAKLYMRLLAKFCMRLCGSFIQGGKVLECACDRTVSVQWCVCVGVCVSVCVGAVGYYSCAMYDDESAFFFWFSTQYVIDFLEKSAC